MGQGVLFGCEARGGFECTMEVSRAAVDCSCEFIQRGLFFALLYDYARLCYEDRVLVLDRGPIRLAAFTGAEARSLGALQSVVKLNMPDWPFVRGTKVDNRRQWWNTIDDRLLTYHGRQSGASAGRQLRRAGPILQASISYSLISRQKAVRETVLPVTSGRTPIIAFKSIARSMASAR